jgi:hypothetical protein
VLVQILPQSPILLRNENIEPRSNTLQLDIRFSLKVLYLRISLRNNLLTSLNILLRFSSKSYTFVTHCIKNKTKNNYRLLVRFSSKSYTCYSHISPTNSKSLQHQTSDSPLKSYTFSKTDNLLNTCNKSLDSDSPQSPIL